MRVYAVSDIHVDYPQNLTWVLGIDRHEYQADVLLLAGDVSEDLMLLERQGLIVSRRETNPGHGVQKWVQAVAPRIEVMAVLA